MAEAIEQLIESLEGRNRQLRELNKQHQQLIQEVEQYKVLAALTDEQADAVRSALQRGKYVDYLLGFLIGIGSSAIVLLVSRLGRRRL